jgi:AraC-like DNA-binding protein
MTLSPGHIVVINPGEIHEGFTDGNEGCFYRMFYLPAELLGKVRGTDDDHFPNFATCAIDNFAVAKQLSWLHRNLTTPSISVLQYESHLLETLNLLIGRYAVADAVSTPQVAPNANAIRQAQSYLAAHRDQKISLETLAAEIGLSPYHFLRLFKATVGMTPHAYQMQMRIDQAKTQLIRGEQIANVAADLGFHDQSHLTKHFKAVVGVTPQRFRQHSNFLQDNC